MVSDQSQDEAKSQPIIGRIPALIAAVVIVGVAIGAAVDAVRRRASYARLC